MKTIYLMFLSSLCLAVFACKEADLLEYSDVDRVQFGPPDPSLIYLPNYESTWKWLDTTQTYSFHFEEESKIRDTMYFDIYSLGQVKDQDRPYKLVQRQVEGTDNAVPGVHYQAFDDPKSADLYTIKAGQSHTKVPVVFFRDRSLKDKPFTLLFEIEANEHFQLGPATNIWRKAIVADRLLRPSAWDGSATQFYWGDYSLRKHQFMIDVTGQRWDQEMMSSLGFDETGYYRGELKKALINYNNDHPGDPLREDENNPNSPLIVFP